MNFGRSGNQKQSQAPSWLHVGCTETEFKAKLGWAGNDGGGEIQHTIRVRHAE